MTIAITSSGIALDGPLVAGEKVAVSVSGLALAAEDKPTLALLARFPDALLASAELAEDAQTPGTWTGELDTATKQTALFFATARADERRDAALELVAGRASLARITVPMANSALCPKPDGSPFASPVYIPVPGPPGTGGDPYDQAPEMDGEASSGTADEYARGDHRHPTDTSRASAADVAAIQGIIPATASTSNKLATAADIPAAQVNADWEAESGVAQILHKPSAMTPTEHAGTHHSVDGSDPLDGTVLNVGGSGSYSGTSIAATIDDINTTLGGKADASSIADVATTGYYDDLLNKPTIPAAQVNSDWNAVSGVAAILNKPTIPSAKPTHIYNAAGADALDDKGQLFVSTVGGNYWTGNNSVVFEYQNYSDRGWGGIGSTYNWKQTNSNIWLCYKSETGIAYKQNFSSGTWHTENRGSAGVGLDPTAGDVLADLPDFFATNNGLIFHKKEAILSSSPYAHFALESLPDRTWAAGTWNVGDLVKYDGKAYRCIAAATSSDTTAPSGDTTHWAQISLLSDKADSAAIRYAFASPTPTVSGTTATVACEDRAINDFTVATGITSLTITPPAAVTGRARDFFCRVTLTDSSLPTVTLSGGTIDIGATEVAGMTQGVNLLMFSEISSGHWLASRRSAS